MFYNFLCRQLHMMKFYASCSEARSRLCERIVYHYTLSLLKYREVSI
jgi:hypothetical protein